MDDAVRPARWSLRERKDTAARVGHSGTTMTIAIEDQTIADVLRATPDASRVFLDRGMHCLGCPFAPFETVAEAAFVYGVDLEELRAALLAASPATSQPGAPRQ
jgi:hybrid cluster-associated redox disulfide protein